MAEEDQGDIFEEIDDPQELVQFLLEQEGPSPTEGDFEPKEFVWILDRTISNIAGRRIGFAAGVLWVHLTLIFSMIIWLGLTYTLTFTEFQTNSFNLALLSITIGNFVLLSGSSLVDHFEEENLNFQAYVHNAVTFVSAGVIFLGATITRQVANQQGQSELIDQVFLATILLLNLSSSLLLMLSLWVVLKLLWRLNQLAFWGRDYDKTMHPYSEIVATIEGFKAGAEFREETNQSPGAGATVLSIITLLGILYILFSVTGGLKIPVIVLAVLSIAPQIFGLLSMDPPIKRSRIERGITLIFNVSLIGTPALVFGSVYWTKMVATILVSSTILQLSRKYLFS